MEQHNNGFSRRSSNATRTYPGTASRVSSSSETPLVRVSGVSRSSGGGGGGSVPTVFVRPLSRSQLAPVHGGLETTTTTTTTRPPPPSPAARPISLDQPRPDSERHRNLYLGAPVSLNNSVGGGGSGVSGGATTNNSSPNNSSSFSYKSYLDSSVTAAEQVRLPTNSRTHSKKVRSSDNLSSHGVVTIQPSSKRTLVESPPEETGKVRLAESSITCPYCRKCRCEACATPRSLPSRWICSKSVHCGPEPFLDYVTCLCCVKALFYHCGKDHEPDGGISCADKPCSCAPHRKFWRWGYMTAMSLVIPCLCLYWPCKGCIKLTEKAYQKYHSNGCTCNNHSGVTSMQAGDDHSSEDEEGTHRHHHHRTDPSSNAYACSPTAAPGIRTSKQLLQSSPQ